MAIIEKVTREDLELYEILRNPALAIEFIQNFDRQDWEEEFELTWYQKEFILDFSSYVSIMAARATGKTVSLSGLLIWLLVFNVFPSDYIVYSVPSKVHLEPVWTNLVRMFRSNSFLKAFMDARQGINSSDFTVKLKNGMSLLCRIAGQSGTGANVIGLHTPYFILDECIPGNQKVSCVNSNKHISDLKVGDKILSWDGKNVVEDRVSSVRKIKREQRVLEFQFNNTSIRVGENHRLFTDRGYIKAGELTPEDSIYFHKNTDRKYWTDEEMVFVKDSIKNSLSIKCIAEQLNRTELSVFRKISSLGLKAKEIYDSYPLTEEECQIILGSLLGDGSAEIEPFRARYRTNHSLKQKEYVDWLITKLNRLVRGKPRISKSGGWGDYTYSFNTLGHSEILNIANELYIDNKKTITRNYLNKLNSLGLAVWFMDDGSESGMFSTHSFSEEENQIIVDYLKEVWNIDTKIYKDDPKNLYFICIKNSSLKILKDIIKDHIPECMKYKIGEGKYNNNIPVIENVENGEDITTLVKTKIESIREVKRTRADYLYDITVENNHNFFVNGILTKNSGYYPWGTFVELQPTINTFTSGFKLAVAGVPTGLREKNVCFHCDMENSNYSKHRIHAYLNPRFTEVDKQRAVEQYGGEESEDYIHLVLAEHGKPSFAIFDRGLFSIGNDTIYKMDINGTELQEDLAAYESKISIFPNAIDSKNKVIMGIDLGYTEPTAILIMYLERGIIHFYGKFNLVKVPYPIQEKLIDKLDSKFNPVIIGIDRGGTGVSTVQHLIGDTDYLHKNYLKRLVPIDFSASIVLGIDQDGQEIKTKTKPFAVSVLQDYCNNHKLVFSNKDLDMITELERMTYTKTPSGDIVYKTLTARGGKRGDDHYTSALLCGVLAFYLENEFILSRQAQKKLYNPTWII
jgi:intein/homing endonuclease